MVLIIGFMTVTVLQNILRREMLEVKKETVTQMKDKVQLIVDHILAVSNTYYINSDLSRILSHNEEMGSYEWYREQNFFDELFYQYNFALEWLDYNISIIGYNGKTFHSFPRAPGPPRDLLPQLLEEPWYEDLKTNDGRVIWLSRLEEIEGLTPADGNVLYALRQLHSMLTGKAVGFLIIAVDIESFDKRLYQDSVQDKEAVYLIDRDGNLVSASDRTLLKDGVPEALQTRISRIPADSLRISLNETVYQAVWDTAAIEGWRIVSLEEEENLFAVIYLSRRFLLIILFLCFAMASLFALRISSLFSRPIHQLAEEMRRVEAGDLSIRSTVKTSDEIGGLAHRFNRMLEKTGELLKNIMTVSEMKRKAELDALQNQVNPHFIYNSLGTIRFMMRLESRENVEKAMISLNRILRYTLSRENPLVILSRELEMTRSYLDIAQKQLRDSLEMLFQIESDTENLYIPKLIIQPLVENAVLHGIKASRRPGRILVRSALDGAALSLEVIDNGIGFPLDCIEDLRNENVPRRHETGGRGIGILNIHDRLRIRFGSAYGLFLMKGEGCRIQIRLPVLTSEQNF